MSTKQRTYPTRTTNVQWTWHITLHCAQSTFVYGMASAFRWRIPTRVRYMCLFFQAHRAHHTKMSISLAMRAINIVFSSVQSCNVFCERAYVTFIFRMWSNRRWSVGKTEWEKYNTKRRGLRKTIQHQHQFRQQHQHHIGIFIGYTHAICHFNILTMTTQKNIQPRIQIAQ